MKNLKTLTFSAAALMATFASAVQADVTIRICGSTAYRAAVHNAIANTLKQPNPEGSVNLAGLNQTTPSSVYTTGSTDKGLSSANQALFVGSLSGVSGNVIVQTDWVGSISGVNAIITSALPSNIVFMNVSNLNLSTPVSSTVANPEATVVGGSTLTTNFSLSAGASGGVNNASPVLETGSGLPPADIAFSDAFQDSTPLSGTRINTATGTNYPEAVDNKVGVIPFIWAKCAANTGDTDYPLWTRLTNITSQAAFNLEQNGVVPASFVTGSASDTAQIIINGGRDADSGTRFDALAEAGISTTFLVTQNTFVSSSSSGSPSASITDFTPVTSQLKATPASPNDGGYSSGGTLAGWMESKTIDAGVAACNADNYYAGTGIAGGGYLVGYLGIADAEALLSPSGVTPNSGYVKALALSYNGVAPISATDPNALLNGINNGTYQYWAYEHLLTRNSTQTPQLTSDQNTFLSAFSTRVLTDADVAGYKLSQVTAKKTKEGAVITPPTAQ